MTVALQSDATLEEGVTYDLIALGRPDDQTLTLLTLMAPVAIQTGDVATPEAADDDAAIAETVVPEAIEDVEASPTPGRAESGRDRSRADRHRDGPRSPRCGRAGRAGLCDRELQRAPRSATGSICAKRCRTRRPGGGSDARPTAR